MKYLLLSILAISLLACSEEVIKEKPQFKTETPEDLIEIVNGVFTEYHPGTDKKSVKFQGPQDEEKRRHGIWYYHSKAGIQVSMTEYKHGLKNGVSIVKYENGAIRYTGEYENDIQIGIWKTYDTAGKLATEKDFGFPPE
ncbi:MAG: antitoxin component YwqK of YwqJK toxin-antitoxin module [Crocinitomicaceae bacterium]|jgi:antitoxin component YwqK of YwqJK toxin-antitoxin module